MSVPKSVGLEYYYEADERLRTAQESELFSLTGDHRLRSDWSAAIAVAECPEGRDRGIWELGVFEASLSSDDKRRRLYGLGVADEIKRLRALEVLA